MLKELRIKNLAVIDDLKVRFEEGFNVLTGETGAGKSIIVDSLGLALGSKVQPDFIRSGEKEAVVQAYFEAEGMKSLPDIGVDMTDGFILRRSIFASGKSRAYVNDTMVSTQSLAEIGRALVDIHGQHEHQSLLSVDKHGLFLDFFGRLQEEQRRAERLYREVEISKREVAGLRQKMQERAHRLDLLKFQIQEIDSAALKVGEHENLSGQKTILSNLGRLKELAESAYELIYGADDSCIAKLSSVISKLRDMSAIDHQASEVLGMLESVLPLLDDAAVSLREYKGRYDFEPGSLDEIEERLALIRKLEKKYGEGIETIIRYRDNAEAEMKDLEIVDEQIHDLENELILKEAMLSEAAAALSEKRKAAAQRMEKLVLKELQELAFNDAEFLVDIRREALSSRGIDRIEFMFSANAGEPPKPLVKIVSGGELSRVMLALKTICADFDSTPVLIFDEIDSGIGGRTAEIVGRKLKNLADKHQVLCTTHLPQLASKGSVHLKIEKRQRNERVYVEVKELAGSERLKEIARMLSGNVTDISLRHAKELLESAA
ncbi:MAG: recN [Nitrospirae bacterium]|nr:recN [Nitrospirota bacterium]